MYVVAVVVLSSMLNDNMRGISVAGGCWSVDWNARVKLQAQQEGLQLVQVYICSSNTEGNAVYIYVHSIDGYCLIIMRAARSVIILSYTTVFLVKGQNVSNSAKQESLDIPHCFEL